MCKKLSNFALNMNIELYIAKRLLTNKNSLTTAKSIAKIAQIGIAAGVCVMLLSIFITAGFKKEITQKLTQFSASITLHPAPLLGGWSNNGESLPDSTINLIKSSPQVDYLFPTIEEAAILKSDSELHGVLMHGIDSTAPLHIYKEYLIEGSMPDFNSSNYSQIVISSQIARLLNAKVGDTIRSYFIMENTRVRPVVICGIITTNVQEIDKNMVICNLRLLHRINNWKSDQYEAYSIIINDNNNSEEFALEIDNLTNNGVSGNGWIIRTINEKHPDIFDWLELLDMNVWVILILLAAVAGFNMVSSLLILILERTTFVGIMKSIGMSNINIRHVFLWISAWLIGKGMLWGNIIAIIFALAQKYLHIIKLDAEIYYMSHVPITFQWDGFILLNISVLAITVLMMIVPTAIISKIEPIKVIRFE